MFSSSDSLVFFDTETTGKYDFKAGPTASHQPRLVQLGLIVVDGNLETQAEYQTLIKPDAWEIGEEVSRIHGITTERADAYGIPVRTALAVMKQYTEKAKLVVCHNTKFDFGMVARECLLFDRTSFLEGKQQFCTMTKLTNVLKLSGPYGYKWPKLQEAYVHFFGREFEDAHDAMADIRATLAVFKEMKAKHPELFR